MLNTIKKNGKRILAVLIAAVLLTAGPVVPLHADTVKDDTTIDFVLVLDCSGTMRDNDPERWTEAAAKEFVNILGTENVRLAVIAMGHDYGNDAYPVGQSDNWSRNRVKVAFPLQNIGGSGEKSEAKEIIHDVTNQESGKTMTPIGYALQAAYEILEEGEAADDNAAVILLSDGQVDGQTDYVERGNTKDFKSIDDAVTDYLPELMKKDPMWQKLTIRHLLDMRSGLDFDDTYYLNLKYLKRLIAITRLNYGHHVMRQIRGLKFRCEPGTQYRYESMTSQILGVVIVRASKKRFVDYLSEKVWKPLQMESPALINIDSRRHRVPHTFGGITLTMKDLAKIGRLYLNRGVWNGQRIVSEEWIRLSTEYDTSNKGYHFNWYNSSSYGAKKPESPGYYALGICAQVLYVNPFKNLIMVRVGEDNINPVFVPELFEQLSNCALFHE